MLALHSIYGSRDAMPAMSMRNLNTFIAYVWFHGNYGTLSIRLECLLCSKSVFNPEALVYTRGPLLLRSPKSSVHYCSGHSGAVS